MISSNSGSAAMPEMHSISLMHLPVVHLKECQFSAIRFYLGADIGGMGSKLYTKKHGDITNWIIEKYDGTTQTVEVNSKEANKY